LVGPELSTGTTNEAISDCTAGYRPVGDRRACSNDHNAPPIRPRVLRLHAKSAGVAPTQEVKGAWNVKDFFPTNVYNMTSEKIG
jgi:hypothetical protein